MVSYKTEIQKNQHEITRRRFTQLSCATVFASLLASPLCAAPLSLSLEAGEKPLPEAPISTASGADFVLSEVREFDLIINFWATWCPPCVHELPQLNTIATELSADGIKVILVSMDRGGAAMADPFLSERNITAPLSLYDPSASWARALALKGLPTTLLIKKNSESYQVHTGPADWDDDKIKGQIKSYLAS